MSGDAATQVTARIDALRDELVDAIARAVRIPSVNPKYPGQVYDEVVGGEGEVSKLVGEVYRGTRRRGRPVGDRARARERRRRRQGHGRRALADLQRARRRRPARRPRQVEER